MDRSELRERFVRWQSITRDQLSFANNLVLSLSLAVLGFGLSLLLKNGPPTQSRGQVIAMLISLAIVVMSVAAGLIAVLTRLCDFRLTMHIIRADIEGKSHLADSLREQTDWLGRMTWRMFWIQTGSFGLGVLCLSATVGTIVVMSRFTN